MIEENLDQNVVELLKRSVEQQGELLPVIKDQHDNILSGRHRKAANPEWRETTIMVTDELDRLLKIIHFNVQRRPSQEETAKRLLEIAKILQGKGTAQSEIVQKMSELVPYTDRWIRELLPDEYKRKYEPKPQIGSTSELPIETQDMPPPQKSPEPVQCDDCPTGTWFAYRLKDGRNLCPTCFKYLWNQGKITDADLLKEGETPRVQIPPPKPKEEKPKPLFKEAWEHRVAQMKQPVSKMDEAILLRLKADKDIVEAGWKIEFQKPFCLVTTTPDVYLSKDDDKRGVYLDGEKAHKNRQERDEELRDMLEKRKGVKPMGIPYPRWSQAEEDRIFKQIKEALT